MPAAASASTGAWWTSARNPDATVRSRRAVIPIGWGGAVPGCLGCAMRRAGQADRGPGRAAYKANQPISLPQVQAVAGHHRPACDGALVWRGVLLDIPRVRDVPWLEPGDHVWRDDLE